MYEAVYVAIDPTPHQNRLLFSNAGAARFAYNAALSHVKEELDRGEKVDWRSYSLNKWWNSQKDTLAPWWRENSSRSYRYGLDCLSKAMSNFFKSKGGKRRGRRMGFPKFKSKNRSVQKFSFDIKHDKPRFYDDHHIRIPRVGVVHCFGDSIIERVGDGVPKGVNVKYECGRWFASILVERPDDKSAPNGGPAIGIDVGIKTLATLSDDTSYANPHTVLKSERKRKMIQRELSRKKAGSKRRERCRERLARAYAHERNIRRDYLDKMTTEIAKRYGMVCIEDLNVSGMVKNHRIAKHIEDASFSTIRRMLEYKCPKYGSELRVIDRYFPSSKRCSNCGLVKAKLGLGERTFACERCGLEVDRDLNAAINILVAGSAPETLNAHGADVRPDVDDGGLTAVKCEPSVRPSDDVRLGVGRSNEAM